MRLTRDETACAERETDCKNIMGESPETLTHCVIFDGSMAQNWIPTPTRTVWALK